MTVYANARKRMPSLTPPFAGDDINEALPAIFRRSPPQVQPPEDIPLPNIAAPPIAPPAPAADLNIATADRVPVDESAPLPPNWSPSRMANTDNLPPTTMPPPARIGTEELANIGAPPMATRDKSGKPQRKYIGEGSPDERAQVYNEAVRGYEPRESKGWRKWLPLALRGALAGFGAGGLGGALAGGLYGGVSGAINPKLKDEQWKQREMAKSDAEVGRIGQRRKLERADQKAEADLALTKERTEALKNPKPKWTIKQRDDGTYVPVDSATGLDPQGQPVRGRTPANNDIELRVDESGTIVPVDKRTGLGQDGKPVKARSMIKQADGTWVDATEAYKVNKEIGQATLTNQTIDQQIATLKARQGAMGPSPPVEAEVETEIVDELGDTRKTKRKGTNPRYTEWREQFNSIQKQIDELEGKRKYVPSTGSPPKVSSGRAKVKSKYADRLLSELGIQ